MKRGRSDNKKMHMIWHDDVSTHGDIVFDTRSLGEVYECAVHRMVGQYPFAPVCAYRHKIEWRLHKDLLQAGRLARVGAH